MRLMNFPNFLIALFPNFVVVFLLALMLNFTYPQQMTAADFAEVDSRYKNCQILAEETKDEMHYYLLLTESGETDLVPSKQHSAFPSRWKIYKNQIMSIEDLTKETVLEPQIGIQSNSVTVSNGQIQIQHTGMFHHAQADHTIYMIIAGILALAELFVLDKLFGRV